MKANESGSGVEKNTQLFSMLCYILLSIYSILSIKLNAN